MTITVISHRIRCPLCDWDYEMPPPNLISEDPNALASVFGYGVFAAHATRERMRKTEEALQEHFSKHTTAEWLKKVTDLQKKLEENVSLGLPADPDKVQYDSALRDAKLYGDGWLRVAKDGSCKRMNPATIAIMQTSQGEWVDGKWHPYHGEKRDG